MGKRMKHGCLIRECDAFTREPEKHGFRIPLDNGRMFSFVLCPRHKNAPSRVVSDEIRSLTGHRPKTF